MVRFIIAGIITLYCIAIWLVLDFTYSSLIAGHPRLLRVANRIFDHTLSANFDDFDLYRERRYRVYTNNLGFKDTAVREASLISSTRRIVLIGDSFTEAIGLPFEDSFAGMLYAAGQVHKPKIEILNAGVGSYSPIIYYKKVKYFLDLGLQFDELVVLPDMSDVLDEAVRYFCIDDDPEYRKHCTNEDAYRFENASGFGAFLQKRFIVTDNVRMWIKYRLHMWNNFGKNPKLEHSPLDAWSDPDLIARFGWQRFFAPLGIEGGITRSLKNMQNLSDLLRARGIKLVVAVYPYGAQIADQQSANHQIAMYQEFCARHGAQFINLFPIFFAAAKAHADWRTRYFLPDDIHYNREGNRLVFAELIRQLFPDLPDGSSEPIQ